MVSVLQEPLKILKKGGNIPESNLKVQVRVRVKAKCVVKRLSVEGVWKRDQNGQARVSTQPWWGAGGRAGSPLPFIRQTGQDPEQSGEGEKAQISCPLAGMHRHFGEGRNKEEWKTGE